MKFSSREILPRTTNEMRSRVIIGILHNVLYIQWYSTLSLKMQSECFCIMSSDNSYDAAFVYMVQKRIEVIKATLPNIKNIEYFTDDSSAIQEL